MQNFVEELVAEYYKAQGYLVMTNYWIPLKFNRVRTQRGKSQKYPAQSWTDIDVLARNSKELRIIQVKAIINESKVADKVKLYFKRVESFLQKGVGINDERNIQWWTKGVKIKKELVYEWENSPASYLKKIEQADIEVVPFKTYYERLTDYIKNKKGVKEENAVLRLLHFIKEQEQRDEIKARKDERQKKKTKPTK